MVTMFAFLPATFAFAHWPISSPAFMLSVANSALAASCGSVGVSSAITVTPWPRAFLIAGTMAFESAGVIRMPLAPRVTMFSIAVIWLWTSVSNLPDAVVSWALFAAAAFCAASFIFTKKGFVSVFVIRPTWTLSPPPPPELLPLLLLLLLSLPPHATTPNAAMGTAAASAAKRDLRIPLMRFSPLKTPDPVIQITFPATYRRSPTLSRERFRRLMVRFTDRAGYCTVRLGGNVFWHSCAPSDDEGRRRRGEGGRGDGIARAQPQRGGGPRAGRARARRGGPARLPARRHGERAAPGRPPVGERGAAVRRRRQPVLLGRPPGVRGRGASPRRPHVLRQLGRRPGARAGAGGGVRGARRRRHGRGAVRPGPELSAARRGGGDRARVRRPAAAVHRRRRGAERQRGRRAAGRRAPDRRGPPADRLPR